MQLVAPTSFTTYPNRSACFLSKMAFIAMGQGAGKIIMVKCEDEISHQTGYYPL